MISSVESGVKFGVTPAPKNYVLAPGEKVCRHCEVRRAIRPRGLCDACYKQPRVLALYPSTSRYARRGAGQSGLGNQLPDRPCGAPAGSAERIAELIRRAEAGVNLNHPDDSLYITEVPSAARTVSAGVKNGRATKVTGRPATRQHKEWDAASHKMVDPRNKKRRKSRG